MTLEPVKKLVCSYPCQMVVGESANFSGGQTNPYLIVNAAVNVFGYGA